MTRLLALALLATALPVSPSGTAAVAAPAGDRVELDGVTVQLRKGTRQVVTVDRTHGHHARVTFWTLRDGTWGPRFRARERWDPTYRRVRAGDHWVLDNESKHDNRHRNNDQDRVPVIAIGR